MSGEIMATLVIAGVLALIVAVTSLVHSVAPSVRARKRRLDDSLSRLERKARRRLESLHDGPAS